MLVAISTASCCGAHAQGSTRDDAHAEAKSFPRIDALGLPADEAQRLRAALGAKDYVGAEAVLLQQLQAEPHAADGTSARDRLLLFLGGVYLLNHDDLHAAVAWTKAEALQPLPESIAFSLAMAYLGLGQKDWARARLTSLAAADASNALFPYWLGRIDYDAHLYGKAITEFAQALRLDPRMARAYDNLGLCYFYTNQNQLALENFNHAIALGGEQKQRSAWPYVNRAAVYTLLGRTAAAEADLRAALALDPGIAAAHFALANLLEQDNQLEQAVAEDEAAARLNPAYAEPHAALARLFRRLGRPDEAAAQVEMYQRLRGKR